MGAKVKAEPTPGPWRFKLSQWHSEARVDGFVIEADGRRIPLACGHGSQQLVMTLEDELLNRPGYEGFFSSAEVAANARLIASAPELLKAATLQEQADDHWANCEECEDTESPELGCPIAFQLADDARLLRRAAIAQATGEGQ